MIRTLNEHPDGRVKRENTVKTIVCFVLLFCSFIGHGFCHEMDPDEIDINQSTEDPLFVSLGSICTPAHLLRYCGLRKAAFPFDWVVSMDGEKLLEMLSADFCEFFNAAHLWVYPHDPRPLFHAYYHLEFLHEGDWKKENYTANLQKFTSKYHRRIERFRRLREYKGKVFFLRAANPHSLDDPHRYYRYRENIEITDEYTVRLYAVLKNYFPELNFTLLVLNYSNKGVVEIDKKLSPNIIKIRSNSSIEVPDKVPAFTKLFMELAKEGRADCSTPGSMP